MQRIAACAALAALLAAGAAHAQVSVKDAWVRATVPQQKATGAFMRIESAQDRKLVSARSPLTPTVEVHEMSMRDNVMRMREVPAIDVPAGKPLELRPGGYHIMLRDLTQQVKEGEVVPLTLVFEGPGGQRENVEVRATVKGLQHAAPAAHGGHGGHKP